MTVFFIVVTIVLLSFLGLWAWQWGDRHTDRKAWCKLIERSTTSQATFDIAMVEHLPKPAQRYFRYTIRNGAPLVTAVEIEMSGELCLGTKEQPKCHAMNARQILAPPHGLVWGLKSGVINGSDGVMPDTSWTRFWLFKLFPIVRVGGNADHHRSAFGRVVSEAAFWVPASLLPSPFVRWEDVDQTTARAIVTYGAQKQAVNVTVAEDGQPTKVMIMRWSNENADKEFRSQPFGGDLSDFRTFKGYTLPTRVTGGNHFGTASYFPFYRASVSAIRFPTMGGDA